MFRVTVKALLAIVALYFLLFFGLTRVGLLGPDEPRYASIGREMAFSGDWVTPRLWGRPWFEKPALLYWMTGIAFRCGLGDDLAPRVPVAAASVLFLGFFFLLLRREFGSRPALYASLMLATSAGWVSFSQLCLTDLPMAAAFAASLLLCLRWLATGERGGLLPAGVLLGVAVLAKGLVPVALFLPVAWMGRKRWRDCALLFGFAALTAAPWYVLCTLANGPDFLEEFFWKHHLARFATPGLQHVQPFWFYLPVLLAALLPWTPAAVVLLRRSLYRDCRLRLLLAVSLFGLVFFSASANKLPGYLLPLLPPLAAIAGAGLARARSAGLVLAACALPLALIPIAADLLPRALLTGLSRAGQPPLSWYAAAPALVLALGVWWLDRAGRRDAAVVCLALAVTTGLAWLKVTAFPVLDRTVSARGIWRQIAPGTLDVCVGNVHRNIRYGLNYYSIDPLPPCSRTERPFHIRQTEGSPAEVVPAFADVPPGAR